MKTELLWDKESLFDHYVTSHPRGDVLQTTAWGKLKASSGWKYFPLVVMDRGTPQASALILVKNLPLVPATIAYSPRGPLFSSPEALDTLLQEGTQLLRKEKALVWKMDPAILAGNETWSKAAEQHNLKWVDTGLDFQGVQPRYVMTLDLQHSLDTLLNNMKSKTRYNIRYAMRKGVRVVHLKEKTQLSVFYCLLQETAKRDSFTIRPISYFEEMWEHLVKNNLARVFLAYSESTPLAGAICFRLASRVWYVYGASSNEQRNLQASHLLQWEMIKWAKGIGCTVYDFRGVSGDLNPEHPLYGLYRFKDGFGAKLETYVGEYDLPILRGGYTLWQGGLALHNLIRSYKRNN
ncbi:MAG: peptidoglycan bridge formation glycyltransferase FemA/FemB family protein [Firmicutes bacterium]|nr:peptidoglycan bridge formation glycyltransferase FemA/FemB family protein [Bacillota bacterium]